MILDSITTLSENMFLNFYQQMEINDKTQGLLN